MGRFCHPSPLNRKAYCPCNETEPFRIYFKTNSARIIENHKLNTLFSAIEILTYETIPNDSSFDLLRRPSLEPGRLEYATLPMQPAIIVAIK